VIEVDDGVQQAAGGGQKQGIGERVGLDGRIVVGHVDGWTVREYRKCWLDAGFGVGFRGIRAVKT
jgi:hypothetical protein